MQYLAGSKLASVNPIADKPLSHISHRLPIAGIMPDLSHTSAGSDVQHRNSTETSPPAAAGSESKAAAAEQNITILMAEDNLVNQKVALALLKKNGYSADVALNGLEAVEAFAQKRYDIILMDINMPEMDGVEATQSIRENYPADEQPYIIAVTANAMKGDREKYLAVGLDDYVSKPIRAPLLIEAIEQGINSLQTAN